MKPAGSLFGNICWILETWTFGNCSCEGHHRNLSNLWNLTTWGTMSEAGDLQDLPSLPWIPCSSSFAAQLQQERHKHLSHLLIQGQSYCCGDFGFFVSKCYTLNSQPQRGGCHNISKWNLCRNSARNLPKPGRKFQMGNTFQNLCNSQNLNPETG